MSSLVARRRRSARQTARARGSAGRDPHADPLGRRRPGARGAARHAQARGARAWKEYCLGYTEDPAHPPVRGSSRKSAATTRSCCSRTSRSRAHCEHHMAPIIGKAAIAYLPTNRVVGISKLARVLHGFARRLQIQERLTAEVAQCIWDHLKPRGVAVVIDASHACMTARGVRTPGVIDGHQPGDGRFPFGPSQPRGSAETDGVLMGSLLVRGGQKLNGRIEPSANKNAVLPVLCATLLSDAPITLRNVPEITDVVRIVDFFGEIGTTVEWDKVGKILRIDHSTVEEGQGHAFAAGHARLDHDDPGPDHAAGRGAAGARGQGLHAGRARDRPARRGVPRFRCRASAGEGRDRLQGDGQRRGHAHVAGIRFRHHDRELHPLRADGRGKSQIVNAACEPHVQEMCVFLEKCGAKLKGKGTSMVSIEGNAKLGGADYTFNDDFHEIATFLALSAVTNGDISVRNGCPEHFDLIDQTFAKFGAEVEHAGGWSRIRRTGELKVKENFTSHLITKVEAAPWPYIPADLLPIFIALGVRAGARRCSGTRSTKAA